MDKQQVKDFIALVQQMRETQKLYFETRDRDVLSQSKSYEREVDRELKRMATQQPTLFPI